MNLEIFVINLDRDTERWHHISIHLQELGLSFSRWQATDGETVDETKFDNEPIAPGIFIRDFRAWSKFEAACGISHIRLLQHIVQRQIAWAMVLEDDGLLQKSVPRDLEQWEVPADADIILLQERLRVGPIQKQGRLFAYANVIGGAGTEGYLISLAGARKLLQILMPLKDPLDFQMYAHFASIRQADTPPYYWSLPRNNDAADVVMTAYAVVPNLVTHMVGGTSSIGNYRHPRARYYCKMLLDLDFGPEIPFGLYNGESKNTFRPHQPVVATNELRWKGVDISHFDETQRFRRDADSAQEDLMTILRDSRVNTIRFGVFVGTDTAFNIERALRLAQLASAYGLRLYIVLHYSDTWADPAHQQRPRQWEGISVDELAQRLYEYTRDIVAALCRQGTPPAIVQVGNEITNGFVWATAPAPYTSGGRLSRPSYEGDPLPYDSQWFIFANLLRSAIQGARDGMPTPVKIMLHLDMGADCETATWWLQRAHAHGVDYDLVGLSFYPALQQARKTRLDALYNIVMLATVAPTKEIVLAETSYPYRPFHLAGHLRRQDFHNTELAYSPEGQREYLMRTMEILRQVPNATGICWWGTTFISDSFDPHGDCFHAQALFDSSGVALPALGAFSAL
jgi:arabinogalactan endo-1,4-beta-galactosidase